MEDWDWSTSFGKRVVAVTMPHEGARAVLLYLVDDCRTRCVPTLEGAWSEVGACTEGKQKSYWLP